MAKSRWGDDDIQFPRLISEIAAVFTPTELYDLIGDSMGLGRDQIKELLDRADAAWERAKATVADEEVEDPHDAARRLTKAISDHVGWKDTARAAALYLIRAGGKGELENYLGEVGGDDEPEEEEDDDDD